MFSLFSKLFALWAFYSKNRALLDKVAAVAVDVDAEMDAANMYARINAVLLKHGVDVSRLAEQASVTPDSGPVSTAIPTTGRLPTDNGLPLNDPEHLS